MKENIKNIELNDNSSLIFIRDDRFKTNTFKAYMTVNLNREDVTKNALIPGLLRYATEDYPSNKLINKELENLYGTEISAVAGKMGEKQTAIFTMDFLKSKYIDENIDERAIDLLLKIIFKPYLENGHFSEKYTEIKKNILAENIKAIKNNKMQYARYRAIEEMFAGENYAISSKGYLEDIEKINSENLTIHYKNLLKNAKYDFILVGEYDEEKIENIIRKYLDEIEMTSNQILKEKKHITREEKNIKEEMDIAQANILLGYNANISSHDENYYDFLLACTVLGIGAHSKLFRNVREKYSLCYSINLMTQNEKGTFLVQAGIDPDKKDETVKYINKEVEDVKNGNITYKEFENARKLIINQYIQIKDTNSYLANFYYSEKFLDKPKSIDEKIVIVKNIKKEDAIKAFKDVQKDTMYFLTRKEPK